MTINRHLALVATLALIGTASAKPVAGTIGTVVATEAADIYTYVQLDLDGEKVWYAVPTVELKVGEKVAAPDGMAMNNFHSKTLGRTFDVVYFAGGIISATAAPAQMAGALPAGHPPINAAPAHDFSGIEKPAGAKTVSEIYSNSAALDGTPVTVRGKAVKVSNNIMGKNWIHLQDGTGEKGANDLTVTSTDTVEVGTVITVSGTLAIDLDFGYSYQYPVLLQDAVIVAE